MDPNQFRKIINEALEPVKKTQEEHTKILRKHSEVLEDHSKKLDSHSEKLDEQSGTLNEHSEKLDSITAELHQVHQLANTTLDVVKGRYEKNKREIDEIKNHLNLPKEPYFGG